MDDVLTLRGFQYGLKSLGEDISPGKVTMPVASHVEAASSRTTLAVGRPFVQTDRPETVSGDWKIRVLLRAHLLRTAGLRPGESAWHRLDPLLRDSYVKLMLRAFSWYVLERTY
jgi:hypothetical protein